MRTALGAELGGTLGRVGVGELGGPQERDDLARGGAGDPGDQVQVVARLLQQPGHVRPAGVAPHVAVGVVPERHVLRLLDGHDLADRARRHQPVQLGEQVGVPVHVADAQGDPFGVGRRNDPLAVLDVERHGLLEQHVVAGLDRGERGVDVVAVARRDEGKVRKLRPLEQVLPRDDDS